MLLSKTVTITMTGKLIKQYRNLGYDTKWREPCEIKIEDVSKYSRALVDVKCDNCGKIVKMNYCDYIRYTEKDGKYYCKQCNHIHIQQTCLERYGVIGVLSVPEFDEKRRLTTLQRYGVEYAQQNKEIIRKTFDTFYKKYGVDHPMHVKSIRDKVFEKSSKTMYQNGTQTCSKNQKHLHHLYGGELNYLFEKVFLDIYFPEFKIYCEYDGSGHDLDVKFHRISEHEFKLREIKRSKFLESRGLKEFRIISTKRNLPSDDIMLSLKNFAFYILNNDKSQYIVFNIDKYTIKYHNNLILYEYKVPINITS